MNIVEQIEELIGEAERQLILLNVAEAELDGNITSEQAKELRELYSLPEREYA